MSDQMDSLLADQGQIRLPRPGDLVEGTVINITNNKILVDLCNGAMVGIVKGRETNDSSKTMSTLSPGDPIKAVVVEDENEEGFFVLSLRKAAQNLAWDKFMKMYETGETFDVVAQEANKGGLLLEIDSIKSFIPVSQLAPMNYPRVNNANTQEILKRLQRLLGKKFTVRIINVDKDNGKLILSERAAYEGERSKALTGLKVGDKVKGKISGIVKFGIFVAFDGLEGLVHISEIAWGHVSNPSDYGKMGDSVEAEVIGVDGDKISLSMKRLVPDPWVEAAKKYKVGDIIHGKISRITTFGAFIQLEPEIHGLIHLSEISSGKVEDIEHFIKVGQEVTTRIIHVDLNEHRIGLSIKAVDEPPVTEADAAEKIEEGASKKEDADELTEIPGVTAKIAETLRGAGYDKQGLKKASVEDLTALEGIGEKTAQKILESV
jgi:small subunit ribosomal protein S1